MPFLPPNQQRQSTEDLLLIVLNIFRRWRRTHTRLGHAVTLPTSTSPPPTLRRSTSPRANSSATSTSARRSSCCLRRPTRSSLRFGPASEWNTARASARRPTDTYLLTYLLAAVSPSRRAACAYHSGCKNIAIAATTGPVPTLKPEATAVGLTARWPLENNLNVWRAQVLRTEIRAFYLTADDTLVISDVLLWRNQSQRSTLRYQ